MTSPTRGLPRGSWLDGVDQETRVDLVNADAEVTAPDLSVRRELCDDALERRVRNRDVCVANEAAVVHAEGGAVEIDEQAAGPTRRDVGVGLEPAIDARAGARLELAARSSRCRSSRTVLPGRAIAIAVTDA